MSKKQLAIEEFLKSHFSIIEILLGYDGDENLFLSAYIKEMWEEIEKWLKLNPCQAKLEYLEKRVEKITRKRQESFGVRTKIPEWYQQRISKNQF